MLRGNHEERFKAFHAANPHVYAELVSLARQARRKGRRRIGVRMIWEVLRWNLTVVRVAAEDFKLNDHYHSRYARLIMEQEPDLVGLFELRELRT